MDLDAGRSGINVPGGTIYRIDNGWVAADDGGWLPGSFADEAAATAALALAKTNYEALATLSDWRTRGRGDAYQLITVAELAEQDPLNTDTEPDLPLIVVPADTETVAVIEHALRDPDHYLAERHRDLVGDERLATAIALALLSHTEGLGLTCGLPGCMPPPITAETLAELDQAIAERDGEA